MRVVKAINSMLLQHVVTSNRDVIWRCLLIYNPSSYVPVNLAQPGRKSDGPLFDKVSLVFFLSFFLNSFTRFFYKQRFFKQRQVENGKKLSKS